MAGRLCALDPSLCEREVRQVTSALELADYRTRVADLYADVRRAGVDSSSWQHWRHERDRLIRDHPQSPIVDLPETFPGMPFFDYDPEWRVIGTVVETTGGPNVEVQLQDGTLERFTRFGNVTFEHSGLALELPIYWADAYSGGLFLPFQDGTNGESTSGSGRYLLDQAKAAHLGWEGGRLILDFNFAYHPSCVWGHWVCPLPRPESRLEISVTAGEQAMDMP